MTMVTLMQMDLLQTLFSFCCHQYANRSPQYAGEIFPVCYRCAGLYIGMVSCYIFFLLNHRATYFLLCKKTGAALVLFTLPLCVDGLANFAGIWSTHGMMRYTTGTLCGLVLPMFLVLIRNSALHPRLLQHLRFSWWIAPLAISTALGALLLTPSLVIFKGTAMVAASGMIVFLVNMVRTFFYLRRPVYAEN